MIVRLRRISTWEGQMIYIADGNIQLTSEACSVHRPISLQTVLYIEKMADRINKGFGFFPFNQ